MKNAISPWLYNTAAALAARDNESIYEKELGDFWVTIQVLGDACWAMVVWPKGGRVAFRLAYSPEDTLIVTNVNENPDGLTVGLNAHIGEYEIDIYFNNDDQPVIRATSTLTPAMPLLIPYWPRDIVVLPVGDTDSIPQGKIHTAQEGTRSGILYFSTNKPREGSVLYLQNLTALAGYNQQTETSAGNTVGGQWPEIGFALPPTLKNKPLEAGKAVCLSDTIIAPNPQTPGGEVAMVHGYLDLLAAAYLVLPRPDIQYNDWPGILKKGLFDLQDSPGCWSQVDGNHYFNAYVCDYDTPPEIMVQLAVLLPLLDYVEWSGDKMDVMQQIRKGLPAFYNDELKTIMRWHPKAEKQLKGAEEQKQPLVMDAWYLHHPLLNLSRLALKGDEMAKDLFLKSLGYAIKVAQHFKYEWPVFYKMDTLEVVKAETKPGAGGEKDVPGLYAHVMIQAWELTGEQKYLTEAERAALKLQGLGFDLFYQANNTAFSAGALLRLYKITQKQVYLDLSDLCLANVFNNVHLWDCNYGYGKHYPSFFALFPLSDAPYTAVYEEQELFCALHDYLVHAADVSIRRSVKLLIAEYIRYLVHRAAYYYPAMLPHEMLAEEIKTGELDPNLWIALEDLHDGWEKSGGVGQEVYGAGNAFGILPRHYHKISGAGFMVYTDYPVTGFSARKNSAIHFQLNGDGRLSCRVVIIKDPEGKLPAVKVYADEQLIHGEQLKGGCMAYIVAGNAVIRIE